MRKNIHVGTKADVIKRRAKEINQAHEECGQIIAAGVNPYAAVVAMDTKLSRIVTFNHPWVNQ